MSVHIGDFVTTCEAGYWQVLDLKPKIADEDYHTENAHWKKGDIIGQWVILKKAFTPKMKPKIDFSYLDASWLQPVSPEVSAEIQKYFKEHPDYKSKFDSAEIQLRPMITNCWINLSEKEEADFRRSLEKIPAQFTMEEFWKKFKGFKKKMTAPPTSHLINFLTYPWNMDKKANLVYFGCELVER